MRFLYMIFMMLMISGIVYVAEEAKQSILAEEAGTDVTIYTYNNNTFSKILVGGANGSVKQMGSGDMPSSIQGGADSGSVGGFSDTFNTILSWLNTVGDFLYDMVNGVPNLIRDMGFPSYVANFIGVVWWGLAIILLVSWIRWNI